MEKRTFALVLIVGGLLAGIGVPFIMGSSRPLVVLSSSMEPAMKPGDLIIVNRTDADDIEAGDIMAFEDPSGRMNVLITHRVINISEEGNDLIFKTKGDAVEEPDMFTVKSSEVVGKVTFGIPFLGYLFHYGKTPILFLILIALPATIIVLGETRNISTYSDPITSRIADKKDRKKSRKTGRKRIDYKLTRFVGIFVVLLAVFGALSVSSLQESSREFEGKINGSGLVPRLALYRNEEDVIPYYEVLSENETLELGPGTSMVSTAPYILPPLLMEPLADVDPTLPSIFTLLVPPVLLTLLAYPLWRRPVNRGRKR